MQPTNLASVSVQHPLVGISGLICSGKSTFARLLATHTGGEVVSFRSFFANQALSLGLPISRENLDAVSEKFLQDKGLTEAVKGVLALRKQSGILVLDGVRMVETVRCIEKIGCWRYCGVFVEADWKIRASRLGRRHEHGDLAENELRRYDERLMSLGLRTLRTQATWNIVNEGTLDDLAGPAVRVAADIERMKARD